MSGAATKSIEGDVAPLPPQSDADEMIDQLNVVCEDFGCEAGSDRLFWLHDQLSELTRLRTENEALKSDMRRHANEIDEIAERLVMSNKIRADQLRYIASKMQFSVISHGGNDNVG